MTKPVLVVKIPATTTKRSVKDIANGINMMHDLNKDYHVMIISNCVLDNIGVEVLNVIGAEDVDIEKLKNRIKNAQKVAGLR
tara:strand:+ start:520 stop:765 length:246 start_codon:yes stop_codon:yes gene_type:complete